MSDQSADQVQRSCLTCRCRKRPGLSDPGYCGERTDTPPAYGPGHPRHQLPADGGKDCPSYEARDQ